MPLHSLEDSILGADLAALASVL